jgi:pyridoxal phosphate enzyme (YggS family)
MINIRLISKYNAVSEALRRAAGEGEPPVLIVVGKKQTAEAIEALLAYGCRDFGENAVQEAAAKWPRLKERYPDVRLHFIGHLQSNKAADALSLCDVVHSVDRPSLVDALARARDKAGRDAPCLLQVNLGEEPQKSGVLPANLEALLAYALGKGLRVQGLMCVPPLADAPGIHFRRLAALADRYGLPWRSMGMSSDYEEAARCGATHVRVGQGIFGERG